MTDAIGFLACSLVLLTFCMRDMASLRLVAIVSNVAFLVYALRADLIPVFLLHALLLPINLYALWSCWSTKPQKWRLSILQSET